MYLTRLLLRNFRNYEQEEVRFSPSVNLIRGDNGQGKTNLIEAIHLVSTGRSFKANSLCDLIHFGKHFFYLEAEFQKESLTQSIKIYYDQQTRKVQYNETIYPTLTSLLGILPSVFLSPDDLSLVSGAPAERRRFLDLHIAQTDPLYVHHLNRYFKAMKQRNHLLRTKNLATIEIWEEMMALSASYLTTKRIQATEELNTLCIPWMENLSQGRDAIDIRYHSSSQTSPEAFESLWQKMRHKEMVFGTTQVGPHRDDLMIHLANQSAKLFSSEGQKRSCITALRFSQVDRMKTLFGGLPLLAIDDFGIQLDQMRHTQLKLKLAQFGQVFLTSAYALTSQAIDGVPLHAITVSKGKIMEPAE